LAENRLVGLRADLDIYATFEGDNTVLLQLVAKRLLSDFGKKIRKADRATLVKFVVGKAADRTLSNSGLRRLSQELRDLGSTARSVGQLRDQDVQRDLLTDRVESMVSDLAAQLRDAAKAGNLAEVTANMQSALIDTAIAHGELLQWEAFTDALDGITDADTREVMTWVRNLFGLGLVEKHLAWYLLNGRLSPARGNAVSAYVDRLVGRLRPYAQSLVDAFGYEPEHLRAEIATGVEEIRQDQARAYYRQLEESGLSPELESK
jgi:acyl-CoA oxidase